MLIRNLFLLGLVGVVSGCTSMVLPADEVRIVGNAEKVYWTYWDSLPSKKAGDIRAHLEKYEHPVGLPVLLIAEPRKYLYAVPVCGGVAQWSKGDAHQIDPASMSVMVNC